MAEFNIGCWAQPPENFAIWKADGVNVAIGPEIGNPPRFTQEQIHQKAKEAGLKVIDTPKTANDLERMIFDSNVIAISLPDEPDLKLPPYNSDPVGFKKGVDDYISKHGWIVTTTAGRKRLYINFAGPKVLGGTKEPVRPYAGQMQQPFVDFIKSIPRKLNVEPYILSMDFYPENQNAARYPSTYPAESIQVMKKWFGTTEFTYWAYLECSDQVLDGTEDPANPKNVGRAPTVEEMDEQLKALLDSGVTGISWFSHKFNIGWNPADQIDGWDGRDAAHRAKCREIAARLNPSSGPIVIPPVAVDDRIPKMQAALAQLTTRVEALEKFDLSKLRVINP